MTADVLQRIIADTRIAIAAAEAQRPLAEVTAAALAAPPPRGFRAALERARAEGRFGLIAEIKKASPSGGSIRPDFDPAAIARDYEAAGAACLSVLTDIAHFQGRLADMEAARAACTLPALRKDFTVAPYQVYEARAAGADCILIIVAALEQADAIALTGLARELGMDVLVEVHDAAELARAAAIPGTLLGINNRNLKTLETDLATTEALAGAVPAGQLLVCESGLKTHDDLRRMERSGAGCFLVGESLLRQPDIALATRRLLGTAA